MRRYIIPVILTYLLFLWWLIEIVSPIVNFKEPERRSGEISDAFTFNTVLVVMVGFTWALTYFASTIKRS